MKSQTTSYKSIISAVIIIGAIILGFYFLGPSKSSDSLISEIVSPQASISSARILNLLKQIKSLEIDTKIFENVAYLTLVDNTIEIPELEVGRPNPFAPIPGMPTTVTGN